uniref:cellulase n=1 Tax=Coptotermes formosanus TaxID=36987 RepID=R4UMC6_COPFO|nr:putative glycosyl hydrolase family7 [Coptotermes formosanus]
MPASGKSNDAQYGGGYCDGNYVTGQGCAEFDLMEANSKAMVFTTHPCQSSGVQSGKDQCWADGCGLNTYRLGDKNFWGSGSSYTVDTSKPVAVVTQFVASSSGVLENIRRLYVQGGKVIETPLLTVGGGEYNSVNDTYCKAAGANVDGYHSLSTMGESLARGHVLVWSLWDSDDMGWLDGGNNGPCGSTSTSQIESQSGGQKVTISDLKFGDIDTTY